MSNLEFLQTASPDEVAAFLYRLDTVNAPCCICAEGASDDPCDCSDEACLQGVRRWLDMEAKEGK